MIVRYIFAALLIDYSSRHNFLSEENCGKCTPCRERLRRMLQILNGLCAGNGRQDDPAELETTGKTMQDAALWNKTFELVTCEICGAPYATPEELAVLKTKLDPHKQANLTRCPDCRRRTVPGFQSIFLRFGAVVDMTNLIGKRIGKENKEALLFLEYELTAAQSLA